MSRHFENRHNDRMTVPGANIPNVYFYEHKCDSFRPLRHFLTFFEKTPKKIENVFFFQTSYFFLFSIVTLRLLAKHYVSITENGNIWRFRALFALFKRAQNSPKIFFLKHNIFPTFLYHIEPAYQKLCFCDFWPFEGSIPVIF